MVQRLLVLAVGLLVILPARAQDRMTLTLDEAIQIALVQNYAMESARLDLASGEQQVWEGVGVILPSVVVNSGYTRNIETANPFAGSSAGTLFNSFGFVGWLAYNEDARTDGDPTTHTLTFDEYNDRVQAGIDAAGLTLDEEANPFAVANQFNSTFSVSQPLFDAAAITSLAALTHLRESLQNALDRTEQVVVDQVRQAFYQALLVREQSRVAAQSVERTQVTLRETTRRVAQGVSPTVERLSASVQLANQETRLVQVSNQVAQSLENLKMVLGIPVERELVLVGALESDAVSPYLTVSAESAYERALDMRADLKALEAQRNIASIQLLASKGSRLPVLTAVANFSYIGAVPSNRTFGVPAQDDPFTFTSRTNEFFSSAYWQPAVSVGFNLRWTLFEGLAVRSRIKQTQIELDRTELAIRQTTQQIHADVAGSLRRLREAQSQILAQDQNVSVAELSYKHAQARLSQGVGTPLEERVASEALDQSRLNYLQAVHDFLIAQSAFETAAGIPLAGQEDLQLTRNSDP